MRSKAAIGSMWIRRAVIGAAVLCLLASIPLKLTIDAGGPLWLDETWTGAIAGQPSWAAVARQAYLDVNAPLYYLLMHLWQGVFGLSDFALRTPSVLASLATPLVVVFARVEGLPTLDRLAWAAALALWPPEINFAQEARGYTLLILLTTFQTVAFIRMLERPFTRRATLWAMVASVAILTHYHALVLAGFQGLIYLAYRRKAALKTWPAALVFLVPFAWLAVHAPRILEFTRPDVAWYWKARPKDLPFLTGYMLGGWEVMAAIGLLTTLGVCLKLAVRRRLPPIKEETAAPWLAALSAVLSAALVIGLGYLKPNLTIRYLVPYAPGAILGAVLLLRWSAGRWKRLAYLAFMVLFAVSAGMWAKDPPEAFRRVYNYEIASRDLMQAHPRRLVFFWDHPATRILDPSQLQAAGGFFFRREGQPVEVDPVAVARGVDANPKVLAQAAAPGSAILWIYDRNVQGTAARAFPPRLSAIDPAWRCRNYGKGPIGILACPPAGSSR